VFPCGAPDAQLCIVEKEITKITGQMGRGEKIQIRQWKRKRIKRSYRENEGA